MVGPTCGTPGGFQAGGSGEPPRPRPPSPPPPDLVEVLAAQIELFRQIIQGQPASAAASR